MDNIARAWLEHTCERLVRPSLHDGHPLKTLPVLAPAEHKTEKPIPPHDRADVQCWEYQRRVPLSVRFHPLPEEQLPTLPLVDEQQEQARDLSASRLHL